MNYDPYGRPQLDAPQEAYLFTGRRYDPETGLYYYRNRYYDPVLGRFVSRDTNNRPSGGLIDIFGPYSYVRCLPNRYTDPKGAEELTPDGK